MLLSKICSAALLACAAAAAKHQQGEAPNILFIFTDDQDARLHSLDYMPNLQKYLVKEGTTYKNHYATVALCCPSRVSLLRGQYSHNTNITDVSAPYGGYDKFSRLGLGDDYLPIWMQNAGYKTYYYGKLMNGYTTTNYNNAPKGFDHQEQLVDPYTYVYDTAVFSINGEYPVYHDGVYQTDVIHTKVLKALQDQRNQTKPFFLWVSPMAPHGQFEFVNGTIFTEPAVPAARHKHLFKDVKVPRTPNFNPAKQHKTASYWKHLERLNDTLVEKLDENHRNRLRALQAVDEMIGSLFEELEKQGKLDNTYVLYSADNGYHLGHHRAYPGKCANIEEDINVPFIVRGPGIPKNKVSDIVSAHHDIAPTLLALAKREDLVPSWVDGGVIPLTKDLAGSPRPVSKESFAVEFWGDGASTEGSFPTNEFLQSAHNTYKTLRIISPEYNYMYAVWCTGDHELYDLKEDEYEINDIYNKTDQRLIDRLDAVLAVLQTCRAHTCRDPWRVLHPTDKSVRTLKDALHPRFDDYYKLFRKVGFKGCEIYYGAANEFPHADALFLANVSSIPSSNQSAKLIAQNVSSQQQQQQQQGYVKRQVSDNQEYAEAARLYSLLRTHPTGTTGHESPAAAAAAGLPMSQGTPVPRELTEKPVDWSKYGFYSVGS